jgi:hypothetical protein
MTNIELTEVLDRIQDKINDMIKRSEELNESYKSLPAGIVPRKVGVLKKIKKLFSKGKNHVI